MEKALEISIRTGESAAVSIDRGGEKAVSARKVQTTEDAVALSLRPEKTTFTTDTVSSVLRNKGPLALAHVPSAAAELEAMEATYTASISGELVAKKIALDFEVGYKQLEEESDTADDGRKEKVMRAYEAAAVDSASLGVSEITSA